MLSFFTNDLKKNKDLEHLLKLPDMNQIVNIYLDDEEHVRGTITELQNEVIKMNKDKRKMQKAFEDAVKERFLKAEKLTIAKLSNFAELKDNLINKINGPLTEDNRKRLEDLKVIL